jgi:dTMP kinase
VRGKYYVLEGLDGVGKSTLAEMLTKVLEPAWLTREPGSPHIDLKVRDLILHDKSLDRVTVEYLLQADRVEHTKWVERRVRDGHTVVSDRSFLTGIAYGLANGLPLGFLTDLTEKSVMVCPSKIFLISSNDAGKRVESRAEKTREERGPEHAQRVLEGFGHAVNWIKWHSPFRTEIIDLNTTGQTPEQSLAAIMERL